MKQVDEKEFIRALNAIAGTEDGQSQRLQHSGII